MKRLFLVLGLAVVFMASCCNNNQQGAQKCDGKAEQNCEKKCDGKHEHQNCDKKCEGHNHGEGTCNKEAKKAECSKQDVVKTDAAK